MARKYSRLTDTQIVEALTESKGLIYRAARKLGCHPDTIHDRRKRSEAIERAIQDGRGEFVDSAESALMEAVESKAPWAIALTLRTIGRNRGYVERAELEQSGRGGGPVEIDVEGWKRDLGLVGGGTGPDTEGA